MNTTSEPSGLLREPETRGALARFVAAGWAFATFLFYAFSSKGFHYRVMRDNVLGSDEWLRLGALVLIGMIGSAGAAFVIARRSREAFLAASYRVFLVVPLGILPLYSIAYEDVYAFVVFVTLAVLFGWSVWLFAKRSPYGREVTAIDDSAASRFILPITVVLVGMNAYAMAHAAVERCLGMPDTWDLMIHVSLHHNIVVTGRAWTTGLLSVPVDHYGNHFAPIEHLSAIVYAFHRAPETIVALQSVVILAGALPVFGIARRLTGSVTVAFFLAASYSVNICTIAPCWYDFHEASFLIPTLIGLIWACVAEKKWLIVLFAVLTLNSREDAGLWVALFGAIWWTRGKRAGLRLAVAGALVLFLVNFVVMPYIRSTTGQPNWLSDRYGAMARGGHIGLSETIVSMATNPSFVLSYVISSPEKWKFIGLLLLPVALLPLRSWRGALLIGPPIAFSVLSVFPAMYTVHYHYTNQILPFLYLASVLGLERLERRTAIVLSATALVATALFSGRIAYHPILNPTLVEAELGGVRAQYGERAAFYRDLARSVPEDGCAMGSPTLATQLASRRYGYRYADGQQCPYALLDFGRGSMMRDKELTMKVRGFLLGKLRSGEFGVMFSDDDVALIGKGRPTDKNEALIEQVESLPDHPPSP